MLREKAKSWVTAYGRPPDFFTVTPRVDRATPVPSYPSDFAVGDFVRARARKGVKEVNLVGRIMNVTVAAVDQAANARVARRLRPVPARRTDHRQLMTDAAAPAF